MVRRLGIIVAMLASVALGQRSDTIWQQLSNSIVSTTQFISYPVNNIGQTGHTLYVTSATCSGTGISGNFQYSWDNSHWTAFGYASPINLTSFTVIATGAYPFVRANYFIDAACTNVAFYYTGVVANPFVQSQGSAPLNSQVNFSTPTDIPNPIVNGGITVVGSSSRGVVSPNVEGGTIANIAVPVGTTVKLNTASTSFQSRWYVSNMILTADTASTVITLSEGTGTTCGTGNTVLGTYILGVGVPLNISKFRTQTLTDDICLATTVGTVKGSWTFGQASSSTDGY